MTKIPLLVRFSFPVYIIFRGVGARGKKIHHEHEQQVIKQVLLFDEHSKRQYCQPNVGKYNTQHSLIHVQIPFIRYDGERESVNACALCGSFPVRLKTL